MVYRPTRWIQERGEERADFKNFHLGRGNENSREREERRVTCQVDLERERLAVMMEANRSTRIVKAQRVMARRFCH